MIAKCANPTCNVPFRYLSEGRLFRLETAVGKQEYFWLCAECAFKMLLKVVWGKEVVAVPAGVSQIP